MSHLIAVSSYLFVLHVGTVNKSSAAGLALDFKPSRSCLARVLSRCVRVHREAPFSVLLASGLVSQKDASCWPWSQNRKRCFGTTLTHRCFLIQAQGELFQLKPNCLQSPALLCIYIHMCECMFAFLLEKTACISVALNLFRNADKCQSLCLASLSVRTQWLGLQAVVQD